MEMILVMIKKIRRILFGRWTWMLGLLFGLSFTVWLPKSDLPKNKQRVCSCRKMNGVLLS